MDTQVAPIRPLTKREKQYVTLRGQGLRNVEIAERMSISPKTGGVYASTASQKLGIPVKQLQAYAIQQGWC